MGDEREQDAPGCFQDATGAPPPEPAAPMAGMLETLLQAAQRAVAATDKVPVGSYRCRCGCGQVKRWEDPSCLPVLDIKAKEAKRQRSELREFLDKAYATIPDGMDWCRRKDDKWKEKVKGVTVHGADGFKQTIQEFAAKWNRDVGSVVLHGKTGVGKTITALAIMHRVLDAARDLPEDQMSIRDMRWAAGSAFVSAPTLAVAWRNCALGEEPDIVQLAKRATLLVLDEVGYEYFNPEQSTTLFEVLDHRYLQKGRPTIITTELTEQQLMARYRPAMYRRIRDIGAAKELKKG